MFRAHMVVLLIWKESTIIIEFYHILNYQIFGSGLFHRQTFHRHLNVTYISHDIYALNITSKYCHARTCDHHRGWKNVSVKWTVPKYFTRNFLNNLKVNYILYMNRHYYCYHFFSNFIILFRYICRGWLSLEEYDH